MADMKLHLLMPNDDNLTMCGLVTLPEAGLGMRDTSRVSCKNCLKHYENKEYWYEKNLKLA